MLLNTYFKHTDILYIFVYFHFAYPCTLYFDFTFAV